MMENLLQNFAGGLWIVLRLGSVRRTGRGGHRDTGDGAGRGGGEQ